MGNMFDAVMKTIAGHHLEPAEDRTVDAGLLKDYLVRANGRGACARGYHSPRNDSVVRGRSRSLGAATARFPDHGW